MAAYGLGPARRPRFQSSPPIRVRPVVGQESYRPSLVPGLKPGESGGETRRRRAGQIRVARNRRPRQAEISPRFSDLAPPIGAACPVRSRTLGLPDKGRTKNGRETPDRKFKKGESYHGNRHEEQVHEEGRNARPRTSLPRSSRVPSRSSGATAEPGRTATKPPVSTGRPPDGARNWTPTATTSSAARTARASRRRRAGTPRPSMESARRTASRRPRRSPREPRRPGRVVRKTKATAKK
jgi:hypothetical protein